MNIGECQNANIVRYAGRLGRWWLVSTAPNQAHSATSGAFQYAYTTNRVIRVANEQFV